MAKNKNSDVFGDSSASDNDFTDNDFGTGVQLAEPSAEQPKPDSLRVKVEDLIHKHFPAPVHGGVEAHQPIRDFLLELAQIL